MNEHEFDVSSGSAMHTASKADIARAAEIIRLAPKEDVRLLPADQLARRKSLEHARGWQSYGYSRPDPEFTSDFKLTAMQLNQMLDER